MHSLHFDYLAVDTRKEFGDLFIYFRRNEKGGGRYEDSWALIVVEVIIYVKRTKCRVGSKAKALCVPTKFTTVFK